MDANNKKVAIAIIVILIIILVIIGIFVAINGSKFNPEAITAASTGCEILPPPANVVASVQNVSTILIQWDPVPNASRYQAFVGTTPDFQPANAVTSQFTDTTQAIISGLTAGITYYVFVQTMNVCTIFGINSNVASIFLTFPNQFKIGNRKFPFYVLGTNNGSTTTIDLETDCQGVNTTCFYTYDNNTQTIRPVVQPNYCVIGLPDFPNNNKVQLGLCSTILGSNPTIAQWTYDQTLGALCNPNINNSCVYNTGPFVNGQTIRLEEYAANNQNIWDVLPV